MSTAAVTWDAGQAGKRALVAFLLMLTLAAGAAMARTASSRIVDRSGSSWSRMVAQPVLQDLETYGASWS